MYKKAASPLYSPENVFSVPQQQQQESFFL
jgi:hypothetical protein